MKNIIAMTVCTQRIVSFSEPQENQKHGKLQEGTQLRTPTLNCINFGYMQKKLTLTLQKQRGRPRRVSEAHIRPKRHPKVL